MTPTQLIYRAWQNTPRPIIYHTHDAKGNGLETECNFVDPLKIPDYKPDWNGQCIICGAEVTGGIPSKKMFSGHYTDWDIHKAPQSDHVCAECAYTMLLNIESRRCGLLRYSFCASDKLELLSRAEVRDKLINPPEPPFVMVCAVSQKKHLAIKSRMSYDRENFFCMLEEECIQVNRQAAKDMIAVIEALRGIGLTKDEIAAGRIRYDKIKAYKMDAYDRINHLLRPCMGTRLFTLCLFVAQKMEEEDAVCFLDLTRKMKPSQLERCSYTQSTSQGTSKEAPADTTCGSKLRDSRAGRLCGQMTLENF